MGKGILLFSVAGLATTITATAILVPSQAERADYTAEALYDRVIIDAVQNDCEAPKKLAQNTVEFFRGQYTLLRENGIKAVDARNAASSIAMKDYKEQCPDM